MTGTSQPCRIVEHLKPRLPVKLQEVILGCIFMIGACTPPPQQTAHDVPSNSWGELCSKRDCEEFPAGHLTVQLDGENYYIPLDTLRSSELDIASSEGETYAEYDKR